MGPAEFALLIYVHRTGINTLMRKRTKPQVEIRNALGELLLRALHDPRWSEALFLMHEALKQMRQMSPIEVNLSYIASRPTRSHLMSAKERELLEVLYASNLFRLDASGRLVLNQRFRRSADYILNRTGKYLRALDKAHEPDEVGRGDIDARIGSLLFNQGLYFECHEFLEEAWKREKGEKRDSLKR